MSEKSSSWHAVLDNSLDISSNMVDFEIGVLVLLAGCWMWLHNALKIRVSGEEMPIIMDGGLSSTVKAAGGGSSVAYMAPKSCREEVYIED